LEGSGTDDQPPAIARTTLASLPLGLHSLDGDESAGVGFAGRRENGISESLVSGMMSACNAARNTAFQGYFSTSHCFSCAFGHCRRAIYRRTFA